MQNRLINLYNQRDIMVERANGCYMYDSNNKEYIDFESGDWAANIGHSNERINKIIKSQIELAIHDGLRFRNRQSEELSSKISELLSFDNGRCTFLNSGSEAVNLAITIAKNLTKRTKILKMDCSYLSAYGHGYIADTNRDLINIPMDNIEAISEIPFHEIAAFAFEPGNARGLIKLPSNNFIKEIAKKIKENNGFLIANEVTTGFGRTGKWFGFQHYDYTPDIVSMGKALGNGYPISGVAITKEVADIFDRNPFRYAQSHQNDPLGCAIAIEVINVFKEEGIVNQSQEKGEYFREKLEGLHSKHSDKIADVRGRGLMLAIEVKPGVNVNDIYLDLIERGILIGCRENVLGFMPPLTIEIKHIDMLVEAMDAILSEIK